MLKKDNNKLLKPTSAIESYFDILLKEDQAETVETKVVHFNSSLLVIPELETELPSVEQAQLQQDIDRPARDSEWPDKNKGTDLNNVSIQPRYSERIQFPVQCLMFYVQDNLLSIPLVDLLSVVSKVENFTRLPQAPGWFLGLLHYRDGNIKIVDSSQLLSIHHSKNNITGHHIIVLKDASWGITCDHLGEIIQLNEEDVKWSNSCSGGLALGIIKQNLAILLDPEKILYRLKNESKQSISTIPHVSSAKPKNSSKI